MGIHTGLVVVGEMGSGGRHEHLALGDTPNLAARLQGLAAPDTVVISAATARLVQGYFVCQDLGVQTLKGMDTPVRVSQVVGESAAQSRLDVAGASGPHAPGGPGGGSDAAAGALGAEPGRAGAGGAAQRRGGDWQVAPGARAHRAGGGTAHPRLTLRCSPYHTNSAFYPVIEHLQRLLHWHRDVSPEAQARTLEQAVQAARLPLEEAGAAAGRPAVAAGAGALSAADPESAAPEAADAGSAGRLAAGGQPQQPVLAVWEDLHWADPSTLELLGLLLDQVPTARLLLVLTCRPEFRPPWAPRSYVTPLTLTRLTRPQVEEMVLRVTGGKPLPAEVVQQIVAKTDGIPLFVEELVKTVLESGLVREADR